VIPKDDQGETNLETNTSEIENLDNVPSMALQDRSETEKEMCEKPREREEELRVFTKEKYFPEKQT
jgi:hypothetical protein